MHACICRKWQVFYYGYRQRWYVARSQDTNSDKNYILDHPNYHSYQRITIFTSIYELPRILFIWFASICLPFYAGFAAITESSGIIPRVVEQLFHEINNDMHYT